jgi:hypothetical protein
MTKSRFLQTTEFLAGTIVTEDGTYLPAESSDYKTGG